MGKNRFRIRKNHTPGKGGVMRAEAVTTVEQASHWALHLQQLEYRGLGDTVDAARFRAARKWALPESWLKRLRYRADELSDVPASLYLALRDAYTRACERVEQATENQNTLRRRLENGDQTDTRGLAPAHRLAAPQAGAMAPVAQPAGPVENDRRH